MFNQGDISKGEFLEFTEKHEREMEKIILRYDNLQIPQTFVSSVELFKLSSETQLEMIRLSAVQSQQLNSRLMLLANISINLEKQT